MKNVFNLFFFQYSVLNSRISIKLCLFQLTLLSIPSITIPPCFVGLESLKSETDSGRECIWWGIKEDNAVLNSNLSTGHSWYHKLPKVISKALTLKIQIFKSYSIFTSFVLPCECNVCTIHYGCFLVFHWLKKYSKSKKLSLWRTIWLKHKKLLFFWDWRMILSKILVYNKIDGA